MAINQQVFCEVENQVMKITVNNPEMKNGLNWVGIEQLSDCYQRLLDEPEIRVAIITGTPEYFYTGGRVDPNVPGEQDLYTNALTRFMEVSGKVTTPMIAAVEGHCMKAGMGVLASCDFAIVREGVRFCFPEVRMGGVPMMVLIDTVDVMPTKRALEALLTSWEFSAEDAYMMGLVNRIVPAEQFWDTVDEFVQAILNTPRPLIDMTRKAYFKMRTIADRDQRITYASETLRTEILPAMETLAKEYNV